MAELAAAVVKTLCGGMLVVAFAALAQTVQPKRFAGVFAAAPSVALASLTVTAITAGAVEARAASVGMTAGGVGFVVYCLIGPTAMRRWRPLRGSIVALVGWFVAAAAALPVVAMAPGANAAAAAASAMRLQGRGSARPPLRMKAGALREAHPKDWVVRFGFGAATSLVAAMVGVLAGPVVGGIFLAFPAVLLASLTLVAEEEGAARARDDARGATFGALGLIAFALLGATGFGTLTIPLALLLCAIGWAVVGIGSFLLAWALGGAADEPR